MKKLLIIMTLFASSFFLFLGDVKAYELEVDVDLTLLDENFYTFKNTMDEFIKNDTTYSDNYIILRYGSSLNLYAVVLPLDSTYIVNVNVYETYLNMKLLSSGSLGRFIPSSDYTSYTVSGTIGRNQNSVYGTISELRFIPLYSNFDILMTKDSSLSTVTYKYNDFTTVNTADGVDKFKTLYMINEEYQAFTGNADLVHKEELEKIEKFYNVLFDRLSYFANTIVSNYVYLSMIVVMIIVLVFSFIFRRYL